MPTDRFGVTRIIPATRGVSRCPLLIQSPPFFNAGICSEAPMPKSLRDSLRRRSAHLNGFLMFVVDSERGIPVARIEVIVNLILVRSFP